MNEIIITDEKKIIISNWCHFFPRSELINILKQIYGEERVLLRNEYVDLRGIAIFSRHDIYSYLKEYGITDIIIDLIISKLNTELINYLENLFLDYKHGSYPSFYFMQLKGILDFENLDHLRDLITENITLQNEILAEHDLPTVRSLELKVFEFQENEILEIEIFFQSIINFINPESLEPDYVYSHENTTIWIKKDLDYFVIKARIGKILVNVKDILNRSLGFKVVSIQLLKELVDNIFGSDSVISASFDQIQLDPRDAKKVTLTDKDLAHKQIYRDQLERKERIRSTHKFTFLNEQRQAKVLQEGKMFINGKFRKNAIKNEVISFLLNLQGKLESLRINNPLSSLLIKSPEDSEILNNKLRYKKDRRLLHSISKEILKLKYTNHTVTLHNYDLFEIAKNFRLLFINIFDTVCSDPTCLERVCCPNCDQPLGSNLTIKSQTKIFCTKCGENINIESIPELQCGHQSDHTLSHKMTLISTSIGKEILNNYFQELGTEKRLARDEIIKIIPTQLMIRKTTFQSLIGLELLIEGNRIPNLNEVPHELRRNHLAIIENRLREKCDNYGRLNCRNCMINYYGNCIQRIVSHFFNGGIRPHSPVEYGDFNFSIDWQGTNYNVIGIAKAHGGSNNVLTLKNNEGLLNQVVEAIQFFQTK
ncbi:MAG: hypothetical protein HeimC3_24090 [Candidatus Heimdallarchaeota archaeon LC_3]|nr:MAG: hypothetical protein HeimC3_24090 [Candidatus Heimdallarchaeota archaeon LC_3]